MTPRRKPPSIVRDAPKSVSYDYAVLRVVPHVYVGAFVPIGVIVHARTIDYLAIRTITDPVLLRRRVGGVDEALLGRYLAMYRAVCAGDEQAGPVALVPSSERFHWLTAPRSDVLQSSPVHEGRSADPRVALDELYARFVEVPGQASDADR